MILSKYKQDRAERSNKFVAMLTRDSEFFGLLSYSNSLYKVYVRPTKITKRWWVFGVDGAPSRLDPIKYQADLAVQERVVTVWAPFSYLTNYTHHPARKGIAKLHARAIELRFGGHCS